VSFFPASRDQSVLLTVQFAKSHVEFVYAQFAVVVCVVVLDHVRKRTAGTQAIQTLLGGDLQRILEMLQEVVEIFERQ
jgi:2-polyprenyl-3-methyl-5-hydroxy-6-metoxy-1,4-benzoquinol methylase